MPAFTDIVDIFTQKTLDEQISDLRASVYITYNSINTASAELDSLDVIKYPLKGDETIYDRNAKSSELYTFISNQNANFTSSFTELTALVQKKYSKIPDASFPRAGEYVIRIGDTMDIVWNDNIVASINVFFIKGGTKIPITVMKEETKNKKSFVIDATHYSDEYVPCKVRVESSDIDTIFDETPIFKVLKTK